MSLESCEDCDWEREYEGFERFKVEAGDSCLCDEMLGTNAKTIVMKEETVDRLNEEVCRQGNWRQ